MSLLIDALKKHRLASTPSLAQTGGDAPKSMSPGKARKIIIMGLVVVIVISATATISFLIFKHLEKKRITQTIHGKVEEVKKVKALLAKNSEETGAGLEAIKDSGKLREKLMEKVEQKNEVQTPVVASTPVLAPVLAPVVPIATTSSAPVANNEVPHARLTAREDRRHPQENRSVAPAETTEASSTVENNDSSDSSASSDEIKVDIQEVPNQLGANNATYQKALSFMQVNQYDKALPLLVDNDDLLLKTQGLSALLLGRIYLTTGQYELADQVLDQALMLHVGSDMDLLALRGQALFMQKKYLETIELLSSQSPDLTVSPGYYALLADAYMHVDQANNAVSVFQQIVARFPNSPEYWLGLAVAYQKTGDASSALVAYRRAAQLSPDDPQVTIFINQQILALQTT